MMLCHKSMYSVGALVRVKAHRKEKEYAKDYKRWLNYIRSHIGQVLRCREISIYRKALILGGCISPWLMSKLDAARRKRISHQSVES